MKDHGIALALATTILVAVGATVLPVIGESLAAYAHAWLDFAGD